MKTAILNRFNSTEQGTFGLLLLEGKYWHSLELPDRDNQPNISCIPNGEYIVQTRYSPSFKKRLYHVKHVPNRSFILIHGANFAGDKSKGWQSHLQGCITLGKKIGRAKNRYGHNQRCVFSSRMAIEEFMQELNGEDFKLIVQRISNGTNN